MAQETEYLVEVMSDNLDDWETWSSGNLNEHLFDTYSEAFAFMVDFNNDPKRIDDRLVACSPERLEY